MGVHTGRSAAARVGWLLALVVVLIVSARGHLPEQQSEPPAAAAGSSMVALVAAGAMLAVSVLVMAIAVVIRMRGRKGAAAGIASRDEWFRSDAGRWGFRRWLRWLPVVLAVIAVWALATITVAPLLQQLRYDEGAGERAFEEPTPTDLDDGSSLPRGEPGADLTPYLATAAAAFLVLLVVGAVAVRRGRQVESPKRVSTGGVLPSADLGTESLREATELGLAQIGDLSRDPREAIVACYRTMELKLAEFPQAAPQDFDTASEVLDRAVGSRTFRTDSASRLVVLFAEARFSRHVMNEGHRDEAEAALRMVLDDLRSGS